MSIDNLLLSAFFLGDGSRSSYIRFRWFMNSVILFLLFDIFVKVFYFQLSNDVLCFAYTFYYFVS